MMSRTALAVAVACLATTACDKDPARSMKIASQPPAVAVDSVAAAASSVAPPREAQLAPPKKTDAAPPAVPAPAVKSAVEAPAKKEWRPVGCPPLPEGSSGPSTLVVTGSCAFQHQGKFACESVGDDFYVSMTRKAGNGSTLMVYINVENYKGPGEYRTAQMFVGIQDKKNIYRWSNDTLALTVGPNQEFAVLPTARLEGEPLLVDCTGPMDNYQCSGRGKHEQLLASAVVASGKLLCEAGAKKAKE